MSSYAHILISIKGYFAYYIHHACLKNAGGIDSYAREKVSEMVARKYDPQLIASELAQHIQNPGRNGSVQCYDLSSNIITCAADELCLVEYDTRRKRINLRGCDTPASKNPLVHVLDGDMPPSIDVICNRDLCNDNATLAKVRSILYEHGVTDADGRVIARAIKQTVSSFIMMVSLIVTVYTSNE